MNVEITFRDLDNSKNVRGYFWRTQAEETLEELLERSSIGREETLDSLDAQTSYDDMNDIEESFYTDSVEDLADRFGIELEKEDEDEEE